MNGNSITANMTTYSNRLQDTIKQDRLSSLSVSLAAITFICVCGLKIWYQTVTVKDLLWILLPTSKLVSLISGEQFVFLSDIGFMQIENDILINKGCSGINFLVIAVSLSVFTVLPLMGNSLKQLMRYSQAVLTAYGITIAANTSRILGAMALAPVQNMFSSDKLSAKLHMAEGMFVYLFFLILLYFLLKRGGIYERHQ